LKLKIDNLRRIQFFLKQKDNIFLLLLINFATFSNLFFKKSLFLSQLLLLRFALYNINCFFVLLERKYICLIIDISRKSMLIPW